MRKTPERRPVLLSAEEMREIQCALLTWCDLIRDSRNSAEIQGERAANLAKHIGRIRNLQARMMRAEIRLFPRQKDNT